VLAHHLADAGQLHGERLVGDDDLVDPVGDLAGHAGPVEGHARREIASLDLGQNAEQDLRVDRVIGDRGCVGQ
jgi:hypothetical protein